MIITFKSGVLIQYVASITAAASLISCGISYGWTSPYLPKLNSTNSTIPTTSEEGSWCVVLPLFGAPIGALFGSLSIDRIGRKNLILLSGPSLILLHIILAFAASIWTITGIRVFINFIDGSLWTVLPTYIAEICEPNRRGFLTSTISLLGASGTLFINIIGPYTSIFTSSLITAAIPLVQFSIFLMMPESPYYYLKKFRMEDAERSLKILRGTDDVQKEFEDLCKAVKRQEGTEEAKPMDLFTIPSNRKACLIFVILCIANKFSGKSPIVFYTSQIFKEAGSSLDPSVSVIIFSAVEITMTFLTIFFIDKFGKRILILTSTSGCSIAVLVLALHLLLKEYPEFYPDTLGWIPIVSLISYSILYSIGLSFSQATIMGELFPTSVKGVALGAADAFSTITAAASAKFFQVTTDATGMYVPFFSFAAISASMVLLMIKQLPETKGKTLEEIQLFLIAKTQTKKKKSELQNQKI